MHGSMKIVYPQGHPPLILLLDPSPLHGTADIENLDVGTKHWTLGLFL